MKLTALTLLLLLIASCASPPVTSPEEDSIFADRPPDSIAGDGSTLFSQARFFDQLVRGKLDAGPLKDLQNSCKKDPHSHAFCFGILNLRSIRETMEEKLRVRTPLLSKPVAPVQPVFKSGKLINATELRKAAVDSLLKGFLTLSLPQLIMAGETLAGATKCPNNGAVAAAATLEDYLPDPKLLELIAHLYEKGGKCARDNPIDRENFFTRSALFYYWAKKLEPAEKILAKVQPSDAFSGRSTYWLYRVRKELKMSSADKALETLTTRFRFSFHALEAAKLNQQDFTSAWLQPGKVLPARSPSLKKLNLLLSEGEALKKFGFDFSASVLMDWGFGKFNRIEPDVRLWMTSLGDPPLQVAQLPFILLSRPELMNTASLELMFPRPFQEAFLRNSHYLSPFLLMAIARKESRFHPRAVSPANAQGLLQLNPDTANRLTQGRSVNLFDPGTSVDLAARHLAEHLEKFKQNLPLAIAAYNAGDEQVDRWVKRYAGVDPLMFMDLIPYRETRDYTGMVLANYFWYLKLYGSNPFDAIP